MLPTNCSDRFYETRIVAKVNRLVKIPHDQIQILSQQPNLLPGLLLNAPYTEMITYILFPPENGRDSLNLDWAHRTLRQATCRALQIANGRTYYLLSTESLGDLTFDDHAQAEPLEAALVVLDWNPLLSERLESLTIQPQIVITTYVIIGTRA